MKRLLSWISAISGTLAIFLAIILGVPYRSRTKTERNKLFPRRYQGGFRHHLGPHESREA